MALSFQYLEHKQFDSEVRKLVWTHDLLGKKKKKKLFDSGSISLTDYIQKDDTNLEERKSTKCLNCFLLKLINQCIATN